MPTSPRPEVVGWPEPDQPAAEPIESVESVESVEPIESVDSMMLADIPAGHVRIIRTADHEPPPIVDEPLGTEYSAALGMPARGVILISAAAGLGCGALDVALTGGLSMFFDLCFIVICLVGAMAVRPHDLFTTGVLAPLVFGGVIGALAILDPSVLASGVGHAQAFLTGLADHATALVSGYAVALLAVAGRVATRRQRSAG